MLLQVKNFRFWLKAKMGQRGAALVEYAILLAFVAVVATAFLGDSNGSMAQSIRNIIDNITGKLDQANSATTQPAGGGGSNNEGGGA